MMQQDKQGLHDHILERKMDTSRATSLGQDDLFDILTALKPIEFKWRELGNALRLNSSVLDSIQATHGSINLGVCLNKVIDEWLKRNYNVERFGEPSWQKLVEAVSSEAGGANKELASQIAKEHLPSSGILSPSEPDLVQNHEYNLGAPSQFFPFSWFHNVNRGEAEKRLCSTNYACFLVRPSERFKESLSVSLRDELGRINHYRIIRGTGWYEIPGTHSRHSTVPQLVSYFKTHSVSDDPRHTLHTPCPKGSDSTIDLLTKGTNNLTIPKNEKQQSLKLTWRKTDELSVAMSCPKVVKINDKLYAGGGFINDNTTARLIISFDIIEETWSKYCMGPTVAFGLAQLNGKLIAVGGFDHIKGYESASNKVYVFDEIWDDSQIPPFKVALFHAAAFSYESNLIVAGGGVNMIGGAIIRTPSVEVYHGATGQWHSAMDLPLSKQRPGCGLSAFLYKDRVYLLHYDQCMSIDLPSLISESQSTSQNQSQPETEANNPSSSSWEILTCPLKCSAVAIVNDKLITIGGRRDGKIYNAVYMFEHNSWKTVESCDLPQSNYYATIAQIDNSRVLVMGGACKKQDGSFVCTKTCYVGLLT